MDRVRLALTGPLASVRTPFNRDGSIDFAGLRRLIDFTIEAGSRTTLLTTGDSHLICMSDREVAELTAAVVEYAAGRTMVVAAEWESATPQAVEFALHAADIGADVLMVRPPDWGGSATVATLVAHYAAVAECIPVMLVTNVFAQRGDAFGLEVVRAVREQVKNAVAVKDDIGGDFARQLCTLVHDRWAVIAGGGLRNHLNMWPFGCDGFMCRFMSFKPDVTHRYWAALQAGRAHEAAAVIRDVELPLERFMRALPGGMDAGIHAMLEIYGIAGRWRRKPYHSLTDEEMHGLRAFLREMHLP